MPKIFIASPSEVAAERDLVASIVRRLNGEFSQIAERDRFEAVRWEESFYTADRPFQDQIDELIAPCEVVVGIVGMVIGTCDERLRPSPEAPPYPSATAYEILSSIERARHGEGPDVFVFFKSKETAFRVHRAEDAPRALEQWERRQAFFHTYFDAPSGRSIGAYQTFADIGELGAKVEDLLRRWTRERFGDHPLARWSIEGGESPFPGLEPFDARHATVYCGRNRKVARALDLLIQAAEGSRSGRRTRPFLLIFGPSGAGKSSLMRAGLAPRLTRPGFVEGVDQWRIAVTRPGETPFLNLARALLVTGENDDPGGFGRALPELAEIGWADPEALARMLETIAPEVAAGIVRKALDRAAPADGGSRQPVTNLLLLVDQLEELLAETVTHGTREAYANLVAALTDTRSVWTVATFRADLYGRLIAERSRSLIALADRGEDYALAPPGPDEIEEIVKHSAELAGLTFETSPTGERLDERILKDAAGGDALPLLQFTLSELFKQRRTDPTGVYLTFAAYQALGGVDGAIETKAEEAVERFGPAEQACLERLLRSLVVPVRDRAQTVANNRALTLRAVPADQLLQDGTTKRVAEALLRARILQASAVEGAEAAEEADKDGSGHAATIKIAHERVLESWRKARSITEANWDYFSRKADIEAQREVWEANGRSDDYLIQAGKPAADAAAFAAKFGDELPADMREFIASSRRRWLRRRHLSVAAWSVAASLVVGAAGYGVYKAYQTSVVASVAKQAVGRIATTIGEELAALEGIQVKVVTRSLEQVDRLVKDLRSKLDDAGDNSGDAELGRSRAAMLFYFGRALQNASDLPRAELAVRESLELRRQLHRGGTAASAQARELADVHDLLGDIQRRPHPQRRPDYEGALGNYRASWAIRTRAVEAAPPDGRDGWRLTLSRSHVRIGDVYRFKPEREPLRAEAEYRTAQSIMIDLVLRDVANDLWKRELSFTLRKLGEMRLAAADMATARAHFEDALCLRRAAAGRGETEWTRDVGFSLMDLGFERRRAGDFEEARLAFLGALEVRAKLAAADPTRPTLEADLATTLHELGALYAGKDEHLRLAIFFYEDALERRTKLQTRYPEDLLFAGPASVTRSRLEELRAKPAAAALEVPALPVIRRLIQEEADRHAPALRGHERARAGCLDPLLEGLRAKAGNGLRRAEL